VVGLGGGGVGGWGGGVLGSCGFFVGGGGVLGFGGGGGGFGRGGEAESTTGNKRPAAESGVEFKTERSPSIGGVEGSTSDQREAIQFKKGRGRRVLVALSGRARIVKKY